MWRFEICDITTSVKVTIRAVIGAIKTLSALNSLI